MNRHQLEELLISITRNEGTGPMKNNRHQVYICPAEKLSIGYGYNLEEHATEDEIAKYRKEGMSREEALDKLDLKAKESIQEAESFTWFDDLKAPQQNVVIEMIYQLGLPRFLGFKKMRQALEKGDIDTAALEMLDSKWAKKDSPKRAKTLSWQMKYGKYRK